VDLDGEAIDALAFGLSAVCGLYARLGLQSFNLALHGAALGGREPMLMLRIVGRAYFGPLERSDVMWSERLHFECCTDIEPEAVAEQARDMFRRSSTR
jgi:galactose-1-phosphate uridylyltransferase